MSEPSITMTMETHMRGSRFSAMHYRLLVDGKATPIVRVLETTGSPHYKVVVDQLVCGADVFDALAAKGVGAKAWILSHVLHVAPTSNRCSSHMDRSTWVDAPDPLRANYVRTTCKLCGTWIGYRRAEVEAGQTSMI